ncbi:hypothetical protein LTR95_001933 [Oleoguttula sp. CCFEE 5521]
MTSQLRANEAFGHANIIQPPLSVVATWPKAQYENGVRRTWLPAYAITLLVFSSTLVCLRIGLRARKQGGGLGLDDAFLIPGWLILVGMTVTACLASGYGFVDRHIWDLRIDDYWRDALNAWVGQFLFVIGTCCVRVSILFFYRRLTKGTFKRRWHYALWLAIGFTITYSIAIIFLLIFGCSPTEAYWMGFNFGYKESWTCKDMRWTNWLAGILALISDAYSICLPALMLWPLELPKRQKLGLMAIFATSSLTIIAAGMRTHALINLGRDYDVSWNGFDIYIWSLLEYNLGIMCACAPSLRALFRAYFSWHSRYVSDITGTGTSETVRKVKTPSIPLVARRPQAVESRSSSTDSDRPIVRSAEAEIRKTGEVVMSREVRMEAC